MSAPVVRPSQRVAAQRRRAFLWLPLMVLGVLVSVAGGSMIEVFNSLDVLGLVFTVAGVLAFVLELDK